MRRGLEAIILAGTLLLSTGCDMFSQTTSTEDSYTGSLRTVLYIGRDFENTETYIRWFSSSENRVIKESFLKKLELNAEMIQSPERRTKYVSALNNLRSSIDKYNRYAR